MLLQKGKVRPGNPDELLSSSNLGDVPDLRLIEQLPFLYKVRIVLQKKSPKPNLCRDCKINVCSRESNAL